MLSDALVQKLEAAGFPLGSDRVVRLEDVLAQCEKKAGERVIEVALKKTRPSLGADWMYAAEVDCGDGPLGAIGESYEEAAAQLFIELP